MAAQRTESAPALDFAEMVRNHPEKSLEEHYHFRVNPITHGTRSGFIQQRYFNHKTPEGKTLAGIMAAIREDIEPPFNAKQQILMALVRAKLVIIIQVGKWIERGPEQVIDEKTKKIPSLISDTFLKTSQSLRSDLTELYKGYGLKKDGKTYEELVEEMKKKV